ncbi:ABC transporter ATP-binding protein [Paenibacillus alvei]|uniref:ABC-type multidrug transport system, ATPase component n=1 Tax=Paenibacillus alvei TaxID=44250 RepID=A0A383RIM1_PAEAL|nr:ABC transporter ATP-binding protein [Paenibacillus alvei]SYX86209.1 ABC-type multidrug transport system, ATPase component [Paenibacillus alvei]
MELSIQHVTKRYQRGRKTALCNVSATLTPGIYGILGPNGAGKSTLMNLITDQLRPDEGAITYNQQPIRKLGRAYRNVLGYMPQQQGIFGEFTARRFLWYIAALKGLPAKQTKQRVEHLLDTVNLASEAERRLSTYSGGMKQRILIAQALLNDPEIVILDEPTAGLDPKERIRLRNFISTIAVNKIVLIATHVVSDIESIAKEILLIKNGQLIAKDTPQHIVTAIEGNVYEAYISVDQLDQIQGNYKISNIMTTPEGLQVRFISENGVLPMNMETRLVQPNLEDLYLSQFE